MRRIIFPINKNERIPYKYRVENWGGKNGAGKRHYYRFFFLIFQLIASLVYFYLFIRDNKKNIFKIYKTSILQFFNLKRFDEGRLQLLKVYLFHSILKQFLTDGANFLMVFSGSVPLKIQGFFNFF